MSKLQDFFCFFLRIALAATLLFAVADRFGFLSTSSLSNLTWGNFQSFVSNVSKINFVFSANSLQIAGWVITILELILGVMLLLGIYHRFASFLTGILFLLFAIAMTVVFGIKFPLNYCVYVASAAAFLLGTIGPGWLALDK